MFVKCKGKAMITISGLTPKQVDMLNQMWSIDSYEELVDWQETLSDEDREMSETLFELVLLADIDEITGNQASSFPEADEVIAKIKGKL